MGSFILWPQVCLSLHNAAPELCAIIKSTDQDLQPVSVCLGQEGMGPLHLTVHSQTSPS